MTDTVQEIAFRYAVDKVNHDQKILPRTRLMAQIERIPPHDSFYASKQGKRTWLISIFTSTNITKFRPGQGFKATQGQTFFHDFAHFPFVFSPFSGIWIFMGFFNFLPFFVKFFCVFFSFPRNNGTAFANCR